jgi:hypothetical protein
MSYKSFERYFIRYGHQISNRIIEKTSEGGGLTVPVAPSESVITQPGGAERL